MQSAAAMPLLRNGAATMASSASSPGRSHLDSYQPFETGVVQLLDLFHKFSSVLQDCCRRRSRKPIDAGKLLCIVSAQLECLHENCYRSASPPWHPDSPSVLLSNLLQVGTPTDSVRQLSVGQHLKLHASVHRDCQTSRDRSCAAGFSEVRGAPSTYIFSFSSL